jgi:uncharacterized integral membrane protein
MRREGDLGPDDPGGGRDRPLQPERSGVTPRQVLIAVFALVLIAFAIANFKTVEVNFLAFTTQARLVTVIVVAAALGFSIGYFVGRPSRLQRKLLRRADKERD